MKRKILLTGRTGQVGSELLRLLPEIGEVVAPDRQELDLLNPDSIRRAVREIRPEFIVNAAAFTAVDAAETQEPCAHAINASAPGILAEEAKKIGAAVIHYSTDYVFDGSKRTPYDEADSAAPINVYGKTKLTGEQAVCAAGVPHLIFRTAWVYSTRGRNFLSDDLTLGDRKGRVKSGSRPIWDTYLEPGYCGGDGEDSGSTYEPRQFSSKFILARQRNLPPDCGWRDDLVRLRPCHPRRSRSSFASVDWFEEATRGRPLITRRIIPITTAEYPTPAARPAFSVLSNSHLIRTFGVELPHWRAQLHLMFEPERGSKVRGLRF